MAEHRDDALDARRYRMLRLRWNAITGETWRDPGPGLDKLLDGMIAREGPAPDDGEHCRNCPNPPSCDRRGECDRDGGLSI